MPIKFYIYSLILLCFGQNTFAQNIKGVIKDPLDEPIAGATIYIKEIKQGLLSNGDGIFQFHLNKGKYNIVTKKIGYKTTETSITINQDDSLDLNIILAKDRLHTIHQNSNKQNNTLASDIIKKIIAKTDIYANAVQYYSAGSYVNGNMSIKKIPDFIDKVSYRLNKYHLRSLRDQSFAQEMYNRLEHFGTSNYKVTEIASTGNIPKSLNSKGAIAELNSSLYLDKFNNFISPINENSPLYYRYRYLGYFLDGRQKIHKIKIEPKLNDPELVRGYLYIADGSWHIEWAEIQTKAQGISRTSTIMFRYFGHNMYLPVSYMSELKFNELGLSADATYYSAVKYDTIISIKETSENFNPSFLYKKIDSEFSNLKTDSNFWDRKRTTKSIKMDSLNNYLTDSITLFKQKYHPANFWFGKIILGGYIVGNESSRWSARYNGTKMIFRDYNYVDGFWLGDKFDIKNKMENDRQLNFNPYIYYTTARHRIIGGSDITYSYAPQLDGTLTLSAGSRSEDFNSLTVTRYQNYFSSLFLGENYNSFYQRDFITASHDTYLNSKIKIKTSAGIEKRSGLSNNTDFNLLGRNHIRPNLFPNDRFDRTFYSAGISYSPFSNHLIKNAFDVHQKQVSPIFHIEYEEGFSSWQTNNSKYRKIKGGIIHNIQLNYFNKIDYKIESGVFLNNRNIHFADKQHFGSSDLLINLNSLFDSFLLLDNYEVQTDQYWVNVFFNYSGKYVLLKYIPFLQGKPFTENIHIKTLFTPDIDSYLELGYSLSVTRNMGIGSFVSFKNMESKKFGIRFSFNLSSLGL